MSPKRVKYRGQNPDTGRKYFSVVPGLKEGGSVLMRQEGKGEDRWAWLKKLVNPTTQAAIQSEKMDARDDRKEENLGGGS